MKYKCGCEGRKILKTEEGEYPKDTMMIMEKMCEDHQQEYDDAEAEKLV